MRTENLVFAVHHPLYAVVYHRITLFITRSILCVIKKLQNLALHRAGISCVSSVNGYLDMHII